MKDNMKLEMEAGRNIQLDHIKEIMKQNIPDLLAENQRLKKQLNDYEKTLKEYAESDNWDLKTLQIDKVKYGWKPALKTLKKWEVK